MSPEVAVGLVDPKFPHNVGAVVRACSAYGVGAMRYSGSRMEADLQGSRLPREERMKGYRWVDWSRHDNFVDAFFGLTPVAVEVRANAENLVEFEHPERALYIFGPEDGSITSGFLAKCHRFVAIPTRHCLNLSMAVGTVLYDRQLKRHPTMRMDMAATEQRGYYANSDR